MYSLETGELHYPGKEQKHSCPKNISPIFSVSCENVKRIKRAWPSRNKSSVRGAACHISQWELTVSHIEAPQWSMLCHFSLFDTGLWTNATETHSGSSDHAPNLPFPCLSESLQLYRTKKCFLSLSFNVHSCKWKVSPGLKQKRCLDYLL